MRKEKIIRELLKLGFKLGMVPDLCSHIKTKITDQNLDSDKLDEFVKRQSISYLINNKTKENDEILYKIIYRTGHSLIKSTCWSFRHILDFEDVLHSFLIDIMTSKKILRYNPDYSFERYINSVLYHYTIDLYRSYKSERNSPNCLDRIEKVDDKFFREESFPSLDPEKARRIIRHLNQGLVSVFDLYYLGDYNPQKVALELGVNIQVVYNRIHQIKKILKDFRNVLSNG